MSSIFIVFVENHSPSGKTTKHMLSAGFKLSAESRGESSILKANEYPLCACITHGKPRGVSSPRI